METNFKMELKIARNGNHFVFAICFSCDQEDVFVLKFTNASRALERLGLAIFDSEFNVRLDTVESMIASPMPNHREPIYLSSDQSYTYDLVGEYIGPLLKFPGASFKIERGKRYSVLVAYQHVRSNAVDFVIN
jgi:hypothetical protein